MRSTRGLAAPGPANSGFLMLGSIYFLIQVASYGLNFWAPQLIRSTGIESSVVIGLLDRHPLYLWCDHHGAGRTLVGCRW